MRTICLFVLLVSAACCKSKNDSSAKQAHEIEADAFEFKISALLNGVRLFTYITNTSKASVELQMNIGDKVGSQYTLYHSHGNKLGSGWFYDVGGAHKIVLGPGETKAFYNGIAEDAQNTSKITYNLVYENPLNAHRLGVRKDVSVHNIYDPTRSINVVSVPGEPVFLIQDMERKPQFPGGDRELLSFIDRNLKSPKWPLDHIIRLIWGAVIEKDGTVSHLHIIRSGGEELDSLALNSFQNPPRWSPGYKDGKPVRAYFAFPVMFRD